MKTKITLILSFILISFLSSFSQDILVYKNGDEVKAKVLEVNTADVKYKKWENQSGPTYTVLKSELFMVKYQNGEKDVFKNETPTQSPVPPSQPTTPPGIEVAPAPSQNNQTAIQEKERQENYDKNMKIFKKKLGKGIGLTAAGGACMIIGIPVLAYGVSLNSIYGSGYYPEGNNGDVAILVGAGFMVAAVPMLIIGPIQLSKSFKYRRMAKSGTALAFEPMFMPTKSLMPMNMAKGFSTGMTLKLRF